MRISGRGLPKDQITSKLEELFVDVRLDRYDTPEFSKSISSLPGNDLKMKKGTDGAKNRTLLACDNY